MVDNLRILLIIEVTLLMITWGTIVWYEVFSRNPQWAKILNKVDKLHQVFLYLVVITGLAYLIINKAI